MFQETNLLTIDSAFELAAASSASEGPRLRGDCVARAAQAPSSNYGAKDSSFRKTPIGDIFDTGERVEAVSRAGHLAFIRQLDKAENAAPDIAIIDALSFSVKPASDVEFPHRWVLSELSRFLPVDEVPNKMRKGGWSGYKFSMDIEGIGLIAWGGEQQRGTVSLSLMGGGCSTVFDWQGLQDWLEKHKAKLNRVDVAHDDFTGEHINIAWAIEQYQTGGFNNGGRAPKHQCFGSWLHLGSSEERKGLTINIGSRTSGKMLRVDQKGKQLGDETSPWVRAEVEWKAQDRHIPYDILTEPGQYLAGAYPCLAPLSEKQSVIKTIAKAAKTVYDKAVKTVKQQFGKLINLMLEVEGGDCGAVVAQLIRKDGFPKRIEPWSYHIKRNPEMLQGGYS